METINQSSQINLKLPEKLLKMAKSYANSNGYTNIQELIRESLREKVSKEELREDYVEKILDMEKNPQYLSQEESEKSLFILAEKALEYKKSLKNEK